MADETARPALERAARFAGSRGFLAGVLLLAATLRVWHVLALRALPLFERLIVDSEHYDAWARRIAAGDWLGGPRAFYMDPLYPYVLAVGYRLVGHDLLAVRLFQVALGVATCALVAFVGRRAGGRAVGNVAALLVAVYAPAIFQEGEVEKTALGVFLVTAALAFALVERPWARLGAGLALGLATLTRGNLLLLVPLGAAWLLAAPTPPQGDAASPSMMGRMLAHLRARGARDALLFLAAYLAVLAPVALRNRAVSGEWILTTSGAGPVFYTGNNPTNASGGHQYVPFVRPQPAHEEEDFHAEAERRVGHALGPTAVSRFWLAEGLRHVLERPAFAALVELRKLVLFWSDVELPDAWDLYFLSRYSPPLRLPLLGMGLLLPLAAVGAWASRSSRAARLLAGFAIAYCASVLLFFVFSRYRLHVVPALAVLAACGLRWAVEALRARAYRRLGIAAIVAGAFAAFSFLAARPFGVSAGATVDSHVNLATMYAERGELEPALGLVAEALAKDPSSAAAWCARGVLGLRARDFSGAARWLDGCVRLRPTYPDAWFHLGLAYEAMGLPAPAAFAFGKQLELVPAHDLAARHLAEAELRMRRR